MEYFKFRAGEQPRPSPPPSPPSSYLLPAITDGYFASQALPPVGYFGGDHLVRPMQYPTDLPTSHSRRERESLRRDLEDESLRLEMIAKESLRWQALLHEVRRDLDYKRELELRTQAARFSLAGAKNPPPIAAAASHLLSSSSFPSLTHGEESTPPIAVASHLPSSPSSTHGDGERVFETLPHRIPLTAAKGSPISDGKLVGSLGNARATDATLNPCFAIMNIHLHARKHKAASSPNPLPKKGNEPNKTHLHCKHCKVNCNSESMLISHLRGKKHLDRMRELKGGGPPVTGTKGVTVSEVNMKQGKLGGVPTNRIAAKKTQVELLAKANKGTNPNQTSKLQIRPQVGRPKQQQQKQQQVPKKGKNIGAVKKVNIAK